MKNLFDYATKELSQDAFLLWLCANFDCDDEELRAASRNFITWTTDIPEDEIVEVTGISQQRKIDISIYISTKSLGRVALFIEDKTTSTEHNQLKPYNSAIESISKQESQNGQFQKIIKLFYKTHPIEQFERQAIFDAKWEYKTFEEIYRFWKDYTHSNNIILAQYSMHVVEIFEKCSNINKPRDNDIDMWKSYFEKVIYPRIISNCSVKIETTRYGYAYMAIFPKDRSNEKMPFLEVRSRDCINNLFDARILMYDVVFDHNPNGLKIIRDEIRNRECNKIFKGNYGQKKNKQVAHRSTKKNRLTAYSDDDFIRCCNESIQEYLDIVAFWK